MSNTPKKEDLGNVLIVSSEPEDCFIITPIGTPESDIFKKTTGLLEAIIEPVLKKLNFKAVPAHYIATPGSIPKQILRHIVGDKLVIANLTGLNPNVMYELAVRHAIKLPIVIMAEDGTKLPFDVIDQRTIFYSDTFSGVEECKEKLESAINMVMQPDYEAENPIYDAIETNQIIKSIAPESKEEYLVNRLDKIESLLSGFQTNIQGQSPNHSTKTHILRITVLFEDESVADQLAEQVEKKFVEMVMFNYRMRRDVNKIYFDLDPMPDDKIRKLIQSISRPGIRRIDFKLI